MKSSLGAFWASSGLRIFGLALALTLAAAPMSVAVAQDQSTAVEDVVVEGVRRNEQASFDFIRTLSQPAFAANTMAVWDKPICLSVENLRPDPTAVVTDRIMARAGNLGVESGPSGCQPNVIVIFSGDAHATAEDLVARNGLAFRPTTGTTQFERSRLRRFVEQDRPVRWWSVWMPVDLETGRRTVQLRGEAGMVSNYQTAGAATNAPSGMLLDQSLSQSGGPPRRYSCCGMDPRGNNTHDILQISFVVVDATLAAGTSLEAMGDYLSMIILSQVDAEADVRAQPTILNLFEPGGSLSGMTRWDEDYLRALYSAPVNYDKVRFQQQEIARLMVTGETGAH